MRSVTFFDRHPLLELRYHDDLDGRLLWAALWPQSTIICDLHEVWPWRKEEHSPTGYRLSVPCPRRSSPARRPGQPGDEQDAPR